MEATRTCPSCAYTLVTGEPFCPHCGAAVTASATAAPPPPLAYPAWGAPHYMPTGNSGRVQMIDRTKSGLTLLIAGALLSWIPIISIIGGLLALVGAILVILGRDAFGAAHSRNVMIAVVLYIIGFFAILLIAISFAASLTAASSLPASEAPGAITDAFRGYLLAVLVAGIFTGLAEVLFLYGLLNALGKVLIWASFLLGILLAAFVFTSIMNLLPATLAAAYATMPPDPAPLVALDNQLQSLRLLTALPSLLSAAAAYVALRRINNGEIPVPSPWEAPPKPPVQGPLLPPQ